MKFELSRLALQVSGFVSFSYFVFFICKMYILEENIFCKEKIE